MSGPRRRDRLSRWHLPAVALTTALAADVAADAIERQTIAPSSVGLWLRGAQR